MVLILLINLFDLQDSQLTKFILNYNEPLTHKELSLWNINYRSCPIQWML